MRKCLTPGTNYDLEIHGNVLTYKITLPEGMGIPDELAYELEEFLHNEMEKKLAFHKEHSLISKIANITISPDLIFSVYIFGLFIMAILIIFVNIDIIIMLSYVTVFYIICPVIYSICLALDDKYKRSPK